VTLQHELLTLPPHLIDLLPILWIQRFFNLKSEVSVS
jgi:hypothetical protein